jgi:c-di-GMP-binding flagellar brake protein YcgR
LPSTRFKTAATEISAGGMTLFLKTNHTTKDVESETTPQIAIVGRMPISSDINPMNGDPKGVPPMKISK